MKWNLLKRLAKDKMTVLRKTQTTVGGITRPGKDVEIHTDVECKFSQGSPKALVVEEAPKLITTYTIFCSPLLDVKEGDKIKVTRDNGSVIMATAGQVSYYPRSHKQFVVEVDKIL